jgi:hypothetical protein
MGKENFHERKQRRIERYKELSQKAKDESIQAYQDANDAVSGIPFGQPILVDHHSEKRHRAALKRSWDKMGKSVELSKKADYYSEKAIAAENNNAISSDDPDAIEKLTEKIEILSSLQKKMKAINKICRSKKLSEAEIYTKLAVDFGLKQETVFELLNPRYGGYKGFASYTLSNNNQNINRLKKRLKSLEDLEQMENQEFVYDFAKVIVNTDDNRVEIYFDAKPDDDFRKKLKSNGFRWTRSKGAWQKHISFWNIRSSKELAEEFTM